MTDSLSEQVAALARRVQRLEDELAIHRLIVRYGLAVDTGDPARAAAVFTDDAVYDVDVRLMRGHADIETMVRSDHHQAMVGHCAHQIGPAVVHVEGDRAIALGYSRVYLQGADGIAIYRVSTNRWELERRAEGWLITRRVTRLLGHAEATAVLAQGLDNLA